MRYPAVRNDPNGFVLADLPAIDVCDPSEGCVTPPSVAGIRPGSAWAASPSP